MASNDRLALPIDEFIPQILSSLKRNLNLVITAAPGAGKTTRVPAALYDFSKKKVAVLEPRRIAAAMAARRVAEENQWKLGDQVGYEVRFDRTISRDTKIHFLTEALLLKKISQDRILSEYDVVILDEFHERSIYTDVAIGFLRELQILERPDLKVIVMSATLDAQKISTFLDDCPIISVPGRLFPIQIQYDNKPQMLAWNPESSGRILEKIKQAAFLCRRDMLVFLPGVYEIEQCLRKANESDFLKDFLKFPLHGRLTLDEQTRALERQTQRKIIFSTNVAESAVTVDGLDCVIDSGLERGTVFQFNSGFQKLTTRKISVASAKQRTGRSGRQFDGFSFRLWTPQDEQSFSEFSMPEVKTQDLSETLLFMASLGISDPKNFMWFEKPPESNLEMSLANLRKLRLVENGKLTELGQAVQRRPVSIRSSLLLENFKNSGHEPLGSWVAALLSERAPRIGEVHDHYDCDISTYLTSLGGPQKKRLQQVAEQLCRQAHQWRWDESDVDIIKKNLVQTFADHLGKRRQSGAARGILANGRGVLLGPECRVKVSPYFIALDGVDTDSSNETRVSLATGVTEEFLIKNFKEQMSSKQTVIWDSEKREFFLKTEKNLWGLILGTPTLERAQQSHVEEHLPVVALENLEWILKNHEEFGRWWSRFLFFIKFVKNSDVRSGDNQNFIKTCLEMACFGQRSLDDLLKVDLIGVFESQMDSQEKGNFRRLVPDTLVAAQDRPIKIQYDGEQAPYVEVRIQHAFGWEKTPTVANGISVTVVLLAPNMRPTQVTKDLEGFWSGSYADVRKELKARYPKHDWPEPKPKK